jgi:hypothetical protein
MHQAAENGVDKRKCNDRDPRELKPARDRLDDLY